MLCGTTKKKEQRDRFFKPIRLKKLGYQIKETKQKAK